MEKHGLRLPLGRGPPVLGPREGSMAGGVGWAGESRKFLVQEILQSARKELEKQAAEFGSDVLKTENP